jgi:hypothetical protein
MTIKLNVKTILNQDKTPLENNGRKSNMHFATIQTIKKLEKHR